MSTTYITDDMRHMLQVERDVMISPPVSESDIRKWAIAVYWPETPPRQFWDADYARNSRWGSIVAPHEFNPFAWPVERREATRLGGAIGKEPGQRVLNGGSDIRYYTPIRPGDVIRSGIKLVDVYEKTGRLGLMLFMINDITWTNQRSEPVKVERKTNIRY
jgi:N-terminal half of MaoC dehydratase